MRSVFKIGFKVGSFVEEDPEEEVGVEVAVNGDFMESMVGAWTSIIAEFGAALTGNMEVDLMAEEVVVDPIQRLRRKVIGQYLPITFLRVHHSSLERGAVTVASAVFVHVNTATARCTDHASHKQERHQAD